MIRDDEAVVDVNPVDPGNTTIAPLPTDGGNPAMATSGGVGGGDPFGNSGLTATTDTSSSPYVPSSL